MNITDTAFAPQRPRLDCHESCTCGQELDLCRHAYCPRCGHRLDARLAATAA
jgi:hypothetical protein